MGVWLEKVAASTARQLRRLHVLRIAAYIVEAQGLLTASYSVLIAVAL